MGLPTKISKKEFYLSGAFSNPKLFRKMKQGSWTYWKEN